MRKQLAVLFLVPFLLAACAPGSDAHIKAYKSVILACEGYATSLTILAQFRDAGKLSDEQIETINFSRPIARSICGSPTPPLDMQGALRVITGLAQTLLEVRLSVEES